MWTLRVVDDCLNSEHSLKGAINFGRHKNRNRLHSVGQMQVKTLLWHFLSFFLCFFLSTFILFLYDQSHRFIVSHLIRRQTNRTANERSDDRILSIQKAKNSFSRSKRTEKNYRSIFRYLNNKRNIAKIEFRRVHEHCFVFILRFYEIQQFEMCVFFWVSHFMWFIQFLPWKKRREKEETKTIGDTIAQRTISIEDERQKRRWNKNGDDQQLERIEIFEFQLT